MIDLRSDTVTLPTEQMRTSIFTAEVGDDAYGEDKSVQKLQDFCKELFNVEAALFVTSGMLANRLAMLTQTSPGDEVVTDYTYHINFFDSAGAAAVCNVILNTRHTKNGILTTQDVEEALYSKPRYHHFAQVKLVSIENTINGWAGKIFPLEEIKKLRDYTNKQNLALHLDGARLFNAHIKTKIPLDHYAKEVDTLTVCFSKGLGAPFGSMLMGKKEVIEKAKRYRVWLGSGVHQIGFQAHAALYALQHHIPSLEKDHVLAQVFADGVHSFSELTIDPASIETNMVQFSIKNLETTNDVFLTKCENKGLKLFPWLPTKIRAVIHRQVIEEDITKAIQIIGQVVLEINHEKNPSYVSTH